MQVWQILFLLVSLMLLIHFMISTLEQLPVVLVINASLLGELWKVLCFLSIPSLLLHCLSLYPHTLKPYAAYCIPTSCYAPICFQGFQESLDGVSGIGFSHLSTWLTSSHSSLKPRLVSCSLHLLWGAISLYQARFLTVLVSHSCLQLPLLLQPFSHSIVIAYILAAVGLLKADIV